MSARARLTWEELIPKQIAAGFLRAELAPEVIDRFEDEVTKGRMYAQSHTVHVDRTVRKGDSPCGHWREGGRLISLSQTHRLKSSRLSA